MEKTTRDTYYTVDGNNCPIDESISIPAPMGTLGTNMESHQNKNKRNESLKYKH
jgi:hypothetical protein